MKFAVAFTTLLAGAATGAQLDSRFAKLQKEYSSLAPELLKLVPQQAGSGFSLNVGSLGSLAGLGTNVPAYMDIDINSLRAAGYNDLASALDKSADLSISAGEKGLQALKALASGNMETAQTLGDEASARGVEALAALPSTTAINGKEIDDLKKMGRHRLADSLANVKRMLDSTDFTLNMMSGMASFANMGDWAEGSTDGTEVISNAIVSKPNINNPNTYQTYQSAPMQQAFPAWQRQNTGRNLYQPQQQWNQQYNGQQPWGALSGYPNNQPQGYNFFGYY